MQDFVFLSGAEKKHFQKDAGGTFGVRFSKKPLMSPVQVAWGVPQQLRGLSCSPLLQGGCLEWRQKDDDEEGYEKNAVPISSAYSYHLRAVSL